MGIFSSIGKLFGSNNTLQALVELLAGKYVEQQRQDLIGEMDDAGFMHLTVDGKQVMGFNVGGDIEAFSDNLAAYCRQLAKAVQEVATHG